MNYWMIIKEAFKKNNVCVGVYCIGVWIKIQDDKSVKYTIGP